MSNTKYHHPWFSSPTRLCRGEPSSTAQTWGQPWDGAELFQLICCCCVYPPGPGVSCLTCASPTCSKFSGFYSAWWDLDMHSLDGGNTKPLSPGHGKTLQKNSLPIISRGGYFPCQPFQSILWLSVFLTALKGSDGGGWRRAAKCQWAIGRGGVGRTMWPRMVRVAWHVPGARK